MTTTTTAAVWSEFQQRIRGFLRKRVQAEDVDDILQDVFVRIHRSLESGEVPRDPVAWVHRIARTTMIDHYRRRAANRSDPMGWIEDIPVDDNVQNTAREELSRCVHVFMEHLPAEQREALSWTALEGQSQVAAAKRAGISVSGMKSRVQRARKHLAAELLGCCAIEFDGRGRPIDADVDCSQCAPHPDAEP